MAAVAEAGVGDDARGEEVDEEEETETEERAEARRERIRSCPPASTASKRASLASSTSYTLTVAREAGVASEKSKARRRGCNRGRMCCVMVILNSCSTYLTPSNSKFHF